MCSVSVPGGKNLWRWNGSQSERFLNTEGGRGMAGRKRMVLFYLPLRGELAAVWETDQDLSEICIE